MDRLERFYKIRQLLEQKRSVKLQAFLDELGVSVATFKRDLEYMRDRFHAPIEWDSETRGYRLGGASSRAGPAGSEQTEHAGPKFELPGLWFNASEIRALLTMQRLLGDLQPGLLEPHVKPLLIRLRSLLDAGEHSVDEIERRIRVLHMASRSRELPYFALVAAAVLKRQRLHISYHNRQRDDVTEREISPQRLVHYRDNWYVDAWCHLRDDLRSFAVDAIRTAVPVAGRAKQVAEKELDEVLASGYGIFSGRATNWAHLRFSAERARWVSLEEWHPQQRGSFQPDGSYVLEIPFSDPRELVMDIMRHGRHVEVLAPPALRSEVARQLRAALAAYDTPPA